MAYSKLYSLSFMPRHLEPHMFSSDTVVVDKVVVLIFTSLELPVTLQTTFCNKWIRSRSLHDPPRLSREE